MAKGKKVDVGGRKAHSQEWLCHKAITSGPAWRSVDRAESRRNEEGGARPTPTKAEGDTG